MDAREKNRDENIAGITPEARVHHGKHADFNVSTLKKCEIATCERFL